VRFGTPYPAFPDRDEICADPEMSRYGAGIFVDGDMTLSRL